MNRGWIGASTLLTGSVLVLSWVIYTKRKQQLYRTQTHSCKRWAGCCALCCFLLASWQIPRGTQQSSSLQNKSVMIMLDVSQSMLVADMPSGISRLDATKKLISNLLALEHHTRWGLGVFAGEALGILPLTTDIDIFMTFLHGVDHTNIHKQGTNINEAIRIGSDRFVSAGSGSRLLLIFTDGGEDEFTLSEELKHSLFERQITVALVGMGTNSGGPIIEGVDLFGNPILKQRQGKAVISKLQEDVLRDTAQQLKGKYIFGGQHGAAEYIYEYIQSVPLGPTELGPGGGYQVYRLTGRFTVLGVLALVVYLFPGSACFFLVKKHKADA